MPRQSSRRGEQLEWIRWSRCAKNSGACRGFIHFAVFQRRVSNLDCRISQRTFNGRWDLPLLVEGNFDEHTFNNRGLVSKPKCAVGDWQRSLKRLVLAGGPDGHAHRFRDTFRWNFCLRACRLSAFQFSWVIKVCALPRSITHRGFGRGRCNGRPTFGAPGRPTNLNKGYTAGTRRMTHV